ncbi:L-type lectin-like domain-containing protein [Phlyctema vagabunda]|uniref:L-type lectin-like domain-containing protein n=1 Tax=Phlyctema vagabunda TaxID=108571 RepID=A0ABR4P2L0_9HELO
MWFSTSLSALALACSYGAGLVAGQTSINADGIKSIPLRTHTLTSPYLDSAMQSRWWDFGGNTIVRADKYIRLSSDRPSQEGWIFSRVPLTATNWEIEVEFKIHGNGNLHGDGFAMWLTKQRALPGPVFGSVDSFEGLGIFFDTYKNNRPGTVFPYVMSMVGDGKTTYDKNNDGKANEFMGCSARGIRNAHVPTKARLTYFQDKSLRLELQYKAEEQWELCFETFEPPLIPSVAYLGFSAETGELSDNHDIISVTTKNLYNTNNRDGAKSSGSGSSSSSSGGSRGKDRRPVEKKGGSWTWFFFKIIIVVLICGGAYVGYTAWRTQQKRSHRF